MLESESARKTAWAMPPNTLLQELEERPRSRVRLHRQTLLCRVRTSWCCLPVLGTAMLLATGQAWCADAATVAAPPLVGQSLTISADTVFRHFDESNGLPTTVITAFAQDGDGFLWIGTQGGLARWDGYRFRNYQAVLGAAGALPNNSVQALYSDPQGRLWIGTDSGLARYDREQDRFTAYPAHAGDVSRSGVSAIMTDGAHGLWVGTPNGLEHFDITRGRYTDLRSNGPGTTALLHSSILSLVREPNGVLWVGTADGLFRRGLAGESFSQYSLPSSNGVAPAILSLCSDSLGHLWIGTSHGALTLDPATGAIREVVENAPVTMLSGERTMVQDEQVPHIIEVSPEVIWLGTSAHGIVAVDARSLKTHRIEHDVALPTSLADDTLMALFRDRAGVVWAGTQLGIDQTAPHAAAS
jgi:ligand-binding sensor domain-containing protein